MTQEAQGVGGVAPGVPASAEERHTSPPPQQDQGRACRDVHPTENPKVVGVPEPGDAEQEEEGGGGNGEFHSGGLGYG